MSNLRFVGLDVHAETIAVCVAEAGGEVRPLGTIFPVAVATISIWPKHAHPSAAANKATIVRLIARPIGDGGVSTISRAAGRKASSCRPGS